MKQSTYCECHENVKKLAQLPTCKKCVGQIWRGGSSKAKVQS